jgi:DNA-directed RNA polymerase specialized sigma subunit
MSLELALLAAMEANKPVLAGNERHIWKHSVDNDVKVKPSTDMSKRDSLAIHLRYIEKLELSEIGERIGLKEGGVKSLFSRLRLAGKLDGYEK